MVHVSGHDCCLYRLSSAAQDRMQSRVSRATHSGARQQTRDRITPKGARCLTCQPELSIPQRSDNHHYPPDPFVLKCDQGILLPKVLERDHPAQPVYLVSGCCPLAYVDSERTGFWYPFQTDPM